MKKAFSIAAICGALANALPTASAVTIFTEDWGSPSTAVLNNGNINLVGWTGIARSQTAAPYLGIYQATGANDPALGLGLPVNTVYFTTLVGTNQVGPGMFYTTTGQDLGSDNTAPFADIDPTLYTNLTFNVEVRNSGGNLTNYFAIQVGGQWYVATQNPLPLYNGPYPTFTNWTMVYTNSATVWNTLTINGTTNVTIGPTAGANLSGPITGIGIVELNDSNATGFPGFNYNQIVINQGPGDFPSSPPVNTAPAVTPQNVYVGGGASFLTSFSGTPNLVYRWQTNGVNLNNGGRIFGATSKMLTITNANLDDALPVYSVYVTNFFGRATNDNIMLVVNPRPPELLYAETFPYVGPNGPDLPITGVGWVAAAPANGSTRGIFSPGPGLGIVYSYSPVPTTNAYFTTFTNDIGTSGLPFVTINPASYPAVTLQAQFAPGNGAGTTPGAVTVYWAVLAGGNWYSSADAIGTSLVQNNYATNQFAFNTAATNWNNLTIDGNTVTIGGQASSDLSGNITGAGLVFVHNDSSGASMNFQNFAIVTNEIAVLPPVIGTAGVPWDQTVASGGGASFGVSATGTEPFSYGWTLNGVPLVNGGRVSGATTPTVTIANLTMADSGPIVAYVTNSVGVDQSDNYFPVSLTVTNPSIGLIYSETFPFVGPLAGNFPISSAGWAEAVPNVPNTLYQIIGGDGAVFAFLGSAGATAYYATTASDTNQAGLPFPNINLASYSDLNISVDIAPNFSSSNVTAYLAVQLKGTNWYVAANPLPVPTASDSPTFATYSTAFDAAAANWRNLTISSSGALIGSPATGNLGGVMTGAGLVFLTVGTGGTFNFDNFIIAGAGVGGINVGALSGGNLNLSWVGNPAVNLQSTTNLSSPNWTDVPNTSGLYSLPVSATGPQKFFRLQGQP